MLSALWTDLRHAARSLRRTPGFTLTAVLTLSLALGATSAIVGVYDTVVLKALPYRDAERLHMIAELAGSRADARPGPVNALHFREWQANARTFDAMALLGPTTYTLTGSGEPVRLAAARVSESVFRTLGVEPALGRTFRREEDVEGQDGVVILSHELWTTRFAADPAVIGRTLTLDGRPNVVVGVLPAGFNLPSLTQLYTIEMATGPSDALQLFKPFAPTARDLRFLGSFNYVAIGRLKDGVSPAQALEDLNIVQADVARRAPEPAQFRAALIPMADQLVARSKAGLRLVLGTVATVLLVACVNITNLLLVRGQRRRRELAIRRAAGAQRLHIVRHVLAESVLLAGISGAVGLVVAFAAVNLLRAYVPIDLPRLDEVALDGRTLALAAGITLATGLLIGLLPALRSARTPPADVLRASASTTDGPAGSRIRSVLVSMEVAASVVCLAVSAMLVTSFARLMAVEAGFAREGIVTMDLVLPPVRYNTTERAQEFMRALTEQVRALPGVTSAAVTDRLPLSGSSGSAIMVEGDTRPRQARPSAAIRSTDGEYLNTMGIRVISGRAITPGDNGRRVAVVSRTAAARLWPQQDPLGRRFRFGPDDSPFLEVVGVAADVRGLALGLEPPAYIYVPMSENYYSLIALAVRTNADPTAVGAAMAGILRKLDPLLPSPPARTMAAIVDESESRRSFQSNLVSLLAVVTLLLSGIGIYGVVSQGVSQRTAEFGIRMALGAEARRIGASVVGKGLVPVLVGLVAGLAVAAGVGRLLRSLLYEVSPTEIGPLAAVCVILLSVSTLASLIPAWRASRIDPMVALRAE